MKGRELKLWEPLFKTVGGCVAKGRMCWFSAIVVCKCAGVASLVMNGGASTIHIDPACVSILQMGFVPSLATDGLVAVNGRRRQLIVTSRLHLPPKYVWL